MAGAVPGAAFERKMRGGRSGPLDVAGLIGLFYVVQAFGREGWRDKLPP